MFRILLFKEIRQHLLTFRFAAALLTTLAVVLVSVWVLSEDYIRRRDAHNILAERSAQQDREVYVPTQINPTLHRPPSPLSIFAQGEDRRFGSSVQIHRWEVPRRATGHLTDNPLLMAEPAFDLMTIFTLVVSLFGILLSYDLVSGERESGTLRLMNAGAVSRGKIITTKFVGGVVCLAIPFLLSFTGSLLVLSFVFNITFTPSQWLAITLMSAAGMVFGALFIAVGLACSALLRSSSVALVLSLLIWALGVMVIPTAAQGLSDFFVPLPSPTEITILEATSLREIEEKVETEFYPQHPDAGSGSCGGWPDKYWMFDGSESNFRDTIEYVRYYEPLMIRRAERIREAVKKNREQKEQQAALANAVSWPSPAHQLRMIFTALADTDVASYRRFLEEARRDRRDMIAAFQSRGYFDRNALEFISRRERSDISDELWEKRSRERKSARERGFPRDQISGPQLWGRLPDSDIPSFSYTANEPRFGDALWPFTFLIVATMIFFIIGFNFFLRYDVR